MKNEASWGPLAGLIGTWEGDGGNDASVHVEAPGITETRYRERMTFAPVGPVDNHGQTLFGLDYRTEAWPLGEENSFHLEVGYWLWDAASETVMRCFMPPRGMTILAGGTAAADATRFTLRAEVGSETFGILSNPHLARHARSTRYVCEVAIDGDWLTYDETLTIVLAEGGEYPHRDRNRLRRVG